MISTNAFLELQLGIIRSAFTSSCYAMGDFNLDAGMESRLMNTVKWPFPNDVSKLWHEPESPINNVSTIIVITIIL